jgi:hypothetical protein
MRVIRHVILGVVKDIGETGGSAFRFLSCPLMDSH